MGNHHMLFLKVVTLSLYIWCVDSLSLPSISSSYYPTDQPEDGSSNELAAFPSQKHSSIWNNVVLFAKTNADGSTDPKADNDQPEVGCTSEIKNTLSANDIANNLANRTEISLNSLNYIPLPSLASNDFEHKDKLDAYLEDFEKIEMHKNNHKSKGFQSGHSSSHLSRGHQGSPYQLTASSLAHYSKILPHHSSSSILGPQTSYNLNYIHSLLTKPSSFGSSSLANLVGSSQSSLALNSFNYPSASSTGNNNLMNQPLIDHGQTNQQPAHTRHQYFSDSALSPTAEASASLSSSDSNCGRQQVVLREPRIVGGNNTYEGEFPWAVSIQRYGNHHCGGVIVGRRWILTAAHCVRSQLVGNLVVRAGGHTLSRSINSINSHLERDYLVEQIVMHDDFSRYDNLTASQMKSSANTNNADIALLKLKNDIQWSELVWPVCFPDRESGNFSGHDATVIGWGKLSEKSEDFSNELQKVKLNIIDNKVCQNWFRQAGREMPIDDRIICAGFKTGGKDACHGDSGGPLLSKINGHYVVVGIVSTGIGCARPLLPGLYSRVSSYIGWIERHMNATSRLDLPIS